MRGLRHFLAIALALLAGACGSADNRKPATPPARVALWEITDASGPRAWIMGTVHALPEGTKWRSAAIDRAVAASDRIVFEIGQELNDQIGSAALARLAFTQGLPPPSQRIAPGYRADLSKVYKQLDIGDDTFANEESWAVALQIGAIAGKKEGIDPENGVEPELRKMAGDKPIEGLETIDSQFAIFDRLANSDQTVLLEQVAHEAASSDDEDGDVMKMWLRGDTEGIDRESRSGFLADAGLREALLTGRNVRWANQLDRMLQGGARPFVAVGASHVSGDDGLPALLARHGWTVRRIQ
ncbi:MAG: TraB/GumN family protein [Sphingomonadales bacterium]|nr:TraB/GumN family protein [Sphingomonadales bacterium]MDE2570105.1 TraB/GumN family protein [Sphingomonadales bacterium]